jgi:hypothetical protein
MSNFRDFWQRCLSYGLGSFFYVDSRSFMRSHTIWAFAILLFSTVAFWRDIFFQLNATSRSQSVFLYSAVVLFLAVLSALLSVSKYSLWSHLTNLSFFIYVPLSDLRRLVTQLDANLTANKYLIVIMATEFLFSLVLLALLPTMALVKFRRSQYSTAVAPKK